MSITRAFSEDYEYTCGSVLLNPRCKTIMSRSEICCETPIQLPYYASGLGKSDLCCYCASEDGEVDQGLKCMYKTVLPLCAFCKENGKPPVVRSETIWQDMRCFFAAFCLKHSRNKPARFKTKLSSGYSGIFW